MLHFIPAWYKQNQWQENEQYWYTRRMKTEFDDTVKHIQLFHRNETYPFQIMLLSFAPNFRHFLHRQGVFHAPYWSCFDAIQEIRRKKVSMFSVHNLTWPEHIEFIYTPFAMIALLDGEKYAQAEFAEDGNLIQVDIYKDEVLSRRNIYDDRGFVSSSIVYEEGQPVYQDYLTDKGVWKIRVYENDGHVEVNPKSNTYLLEHNGQEYTRVFLQNSYEKMERIISEVLGSYLELSEESDMFCIAVHELHMEVLCQALSGRKMILSFFENRYDPAKYPEILDIIKSSSYVLTDSQENYRKVQKMMNFDSECIACITPFDARVDFGISQQLNVQKILVPVDGMEEERFAELIQRLGEYILINENARIHLFTRLADYDRGSKLLEKVRERLRNAGMEEGWAAEEMEKSQEENYLLDEEKIPIRFYVEQCVDELAVSKCMREQRLIVDLRSKTDVYLRVMGISVGIPQIVYRDTEFVENGKNGRILKDMSALPETMAFYLESLTNWNEAMLSAYEHGKNYKTDVLIEKWKEVIDFVRNNKSSSTGK